MLQNILSSPVEKQSHKVFVHSMQNMQVFWLRMPCKILKLVGLGATADKEAQIQDGRNNKLHTRS